MEQRWPWQGKIRITVERDGVTVETVDLSNLITDVGKNLLRDALQDSTFDAEIHYIALGGSSTAPAAGDTTLVDEQFRKQVTSQEAGSSAGEVVTTTYIAPGEANGFTIEEIGWFAGDGASGTADSGVLIARVLYSRAKNAEESLQIERTDTIG